MSILNRPGWANRSILNEGRLHSDELKQRITNLFVRTSLGNSPTYVVNKISDILRKEKGDDVDINDIADEDIIRIANDQEVTNGKFEPQLKSSIADARMESEGEMSGVDSGLPSEQGEDNHEDDFESEDNHEDQTEDDYSSEDETDEDAQDCQDCQDYEKEDCEDYHDYDDQRPEDETPINSVIKKENVRLSQKAINNLLRENYIKSRQHKFSIEQRYRNY